MWVKQQWVREVVPGDDACGAEDSEIIRTSAVKKNIGYRVVRLAGLSKIQDEMCRLVIRASVSMTGDQRRVVYCRSVPKAEVLGEKLGCRCYHSRMDERRKAGCARPEKSPRMRPSIIQACDLLGKH